MKRLLSIILLFILSSVMFLSSAMGVNAATLVTSDEYPDFVFSSDWDDTFAVYSYVGTNPDMVVPEYVYDRYVKRIDDKAFYQNSVINTAYLHDGMTQIRKWGFRKCENLENVYYSKDFIVFYDYAFSDNPKLSSALLRNTKINALYSGAYYNDPALKYVSLPDTMVTLGPSVFAKTAIDTFVVPSGVETVDNMCFAYNESLTSLYVPASVTRIGSNVFHNTPNVTVYGIEGSTIQTYCEDNNVNFVAINEADYPSNTLGDVNNDGEVSIRDVTAMQLSLANISTTFFSQNCDVNEDCKFNINDATYIQHKLAGFYD